MSKQSRRANRRNRPGRQRDAAGPQPLKVVIATAIDNTSAGVSLATDVELVRSAVLYADEVELVSPGAAMLGSLVAFASGDGEELIALLTSFDDQTMRHLGAASLPSDLREMLPMMALDADQWDLLEALSGKPLPDGLRHATTEYRTLLAKSMEDMRAVADELMQSSGASELVPAVESGLVTLSAAGMDTGDTDQMVQAYVEILRRHLMDPKVHLMFDEAAGSLVRNLVDEGIVYPSRLSVGHAGAATVGSGMIARLPAFPGTPLDELLDLRADLDVPLARYRRSVSRMASALRVRAFDREISAELDDLWRNEIDPSLVDIREGLAQHGLIRELARSMSSDVTSFVAATTGSSISVGISSLADLSGVVSAAAGALPAAAVVAGHLGHAHSGRSAAHEEARSHDLFYLYEVDKRSQARRTPDET